MSKLFIRPQDLKEDQKYIIEFPNGDIVNCKLERILTYSNFGADYLFKKKKGETGGPTHPEYKNRFVLSSELIQIVHILSKKKEKEEKEPVE
jgi:hypothetical protein